MVLIPEGQYGYVTGYGAPAVRRVACSFCNAEVAAEADLALMLRAVIEHERFAHGRVHDAG